MSISTKSTRPLFPNPEIILFQSTNLSILSQAFLTVPFRAHCILTMSFSIAAFITRKAGTSPAAFKTYYENVHLPLIQDLFGPTFPISYSRWYIPQKPVEDEASDPSNIKYTPTVLLGSAENFHYDLYCELVFEDEKSFGAFFERFQAPEVVAKIKEDNDKCLDSGLFFVVEKPIVTRKGEK